jgi:hypothetical protein
MTHKTVPDIPDGMRKICRRFERWRSSHQGRFTIPLALWAAAAEVGAATCSRTILDQIIASLVRGADFSLL